MRKKTRRYLFASFDDIEQEGFTKYHLICDRLFVFVSEQQKSIPLNVVINLQKLGKGVRWIKSTSADLKTNSYLLSFMLGKLHERLPSDIEFAVLSDGKDFDALIDLINRKGRSCLRILSHEALGTTEDSEEQEEQSMVYSKVKEEKPIPVLHTEIPERSFIEKNNGEDATDNSIRAKAVKVTNWLMKSGNRPAEIGLLKQYISLNNPDLQPGNAEKIITFMAMSNDIQIEDKVVVYNF